MSACNRLDLETLRSRPIMPKNLPRHSAIWVGNQSKEELGEGKLAHQPFCRFVDSPKLLHMRFIGVHGNNLCKLPLVKLVHHSVRSFQARYKCLFLIPRILEYDPSSTMRKHSAWRLKCITLLRTSNLIHHPVSTLVTRLALIRRSHQTTNIESMSKHEVSMWSFSTWC